MHSTITVKHYTDVDSLIDLLSSHPGVEKVSSTVALTPKMAKAILDHIKSEIGQRHIDEWSDVIQSWSCELEAISQVYGCKAAVKELRKLSEI